MSLHVYLTTYLSIHWCVYLVYEAHVELYLMVPCSTRVECVCMTVFSGSFAKGVKALRLCSAIRGPA